MKYQKKPVVIEAFKWTADQEQSEDPEWIIKAIKNGTVTFINKETSDVKLVIKTLEGNHIANRGDYIIQGVHGELYPCKPDIFEETYEKVEEK
ncbi:hypothetical protein [Lentilactobacillus hilgardii]|jgi:hypothetical protein|uniref:hypothetical protein n=1 Tax=Lentilactobacillus hilgardii TaxID=1588 RepID=UPI000FF25865|nr:hypothetical protein [Lentilactobacillus hilgardii]MCP9331909.1 hypothetical protein [Lentilactobacillus hilgardii]MCP9348476.1 hypothetical protein [Lentilactobacillus hilgardii]MCP9351324.1 hypothetical protein [Lentilactobacillus hilgardii]RRG11656.1 MAG: hypothetical protein DUD35_05475 [Lactobacillus sp.]